VNKSKNGNFKGEIANDAKLIYNDIKGGTVAKYNFRHSEGGHRPTEESIYRRDSSLRPLGFVQNDVEFVILQ